MSWSPVTAEDLDRGVVEVDDPHVETGLAVSVVARAAGGDLLDGEEHHPDQ